jgi:hypothetical protein
MGWSLIRRSDDRTVKKVFLGKPDGRRKAGIPELIWPNCIENDVKLLSVEIEEEIRRQICMGYHYEEGIGLTARTICH